MRLPSRLSDVAVERVRRTKKNNLSKSQSEFQTPPPDNILLERVLAAPGDGSPLGEKQIFYPLNI